MERIAISVPSLTLTASSAKNPRGISVVARTDCMALIPPVKPTPAGASTSSKMSQSQNCTPEHTCAHLRHVLKRVERDCKRDGCLGEILDVAASLVHCGGSALSRSCAFRNSGSLPYRAKAIVCRYIPSRRQASRSYSTRSTNEASRWPVPCAGRRRIPDLYCLTRVSNLSKVSSK
jgi:hypothetical protein